MPRQPTLTLPRVNFLISHSKWNSSFYFLYQRWCSKMSSSLFCLTHIVIPHNIQCHPTLWSALFFQSHTHLCAAFAFISEFPTLLRLWNGKQHQQTVCKNEVRFNKKGRSATENTECTFKRAVGEQHIFFCQSWKRVIFALISLKIV